MSIIKEVEEKVLKKINEAGYELEKFTLQVTNRKDLGQYQINDAMSLVKKYHKNPREIAEDIVAKIEELGIFENINIAGPGFINVSLKQEFLIDAVNRMKEDMKSNIDQEKRKRIV